MKILTKCFKLEARLFLNVTKSVTEQTKSTALEIYFRKFCRKSNTRDFIEIPDLNEHLIFLQCELFGVPFEL